VHPEESRLDAANSVTINSGFGPTIVPGFSTQSASVVVEMETGQTLAIGGLINHATQNNANKIPVLGDLPILGAAFRSVSAQETETELVILVTPHLVDPMSHDQLPKYLPGQETRSPDCYELFLEGILEAPRGQRTVRHGRDFEAAYKNGPSAAQYPCGDGRNGAGGCSGGTCGTAAPAAVMPAATGSHAGLPSLPNGTGNGSMTTTSPAPMPGTLPSAVLKGE
jgi:pilus assembly protein CpaC